MDKFFSRVGVIALVVLAVIAVRYTVSGTGVAGIFAPVFPTDTAVAASQDVPVTTLRDLNNALADIAEKTSPAVVTVSTRKTVRVNTGVSIFDFFNGRTPGQREYTQEGLGSGVIVTQDGYILTNHHVVANSDTIFVTTADNRQLSAKLVGSDPSTDVAVIKVENPAALTAIVMGNSDDVRVGEMVMAIGSPLAANLASTVTMGIVSGKGRYNLAEPQTQDGPTYEDFIQTDAAINPGNSGGALVNLDGELVGINSAIITRSGGFQGIGLAIPVNMARRVMDDLITKGRVVRAYLGVLPQNIDDNLAKALNLRDNNGVLLAQVFEDTPAAKAGLESGDVVTHVNGEVVPNASRFQLKLGSLKPGDSASLRILRDGREQTLNVTLDEFPSNEQLAVRDPDTGRTTNTSYGFQVQTLESNTARRLGLNPNLRGVAVTAIDPQSSAYDAGLRENDVIVAVANQRIADADRFNSFMERIAPGSMVLMQVVRGNSSFYIAFEK